MIRRMCFNNWIVGILLVHRDISRIILVTLVAQHRSEHVPRIQLPSLLPIRHPGVYEFGLACS